MKLLGRYLRSLYGRMAVGISIKALGTFAELILPYILSHILKNVVQLESIPMIAMWGGLMLICALIACFANITANRMAARVARDFSNRMRNDLFQRTLNLSAAQIDRFTVPSLESRITTDTYNVHNFVWMMQCMGVRAPILLIGGAIITLMMDSYLAIIMLSTMPLIFIAVYFISRKGIPLYVKVQKSVDKMVRVIREDVQGIRVIKALSKSEYEHERFDNKNKALVRDERKAGITMGLVNPVMTLLMNLGIVSVVALSANRVANAQSDPETVIAFIQYFTLISMAMMGITRILVMYTKCSASANRILEVLDTKEDLIIKSENEYPRINSQSHIKFDNVSFSYNGVKTDAENISFELKKGQSLGIIGATGSGKSTLLRLLLRFYDVNKGAIYIDNRDIRTINRSELYSKFGVAMQNDFIYSDTIMENIKFNRDISDEDMKRAAEIAQANSFIEEFPDGYNHMLSTKGTNISGGQRQRILIARALCSKPDILILDDSSSALDYKTDAALRASLKENLSDTTMIMVAQRVSSIKNCDIILVIDEGKIIGKGNHEELCASCTEYREISESQMGGAFVE